MTEHLTRWPNITESSLSTLSARSLVGCQQGHAASEDTREERFFPFPLLLVALVYNSYDTKLCFILMAFFLPSPGLPKVTPIVLPVGPPYSRMDLFLFFFPIFMYVCVHV